MRNVITLCWQYLRAFVFIYLCLWAGNGLSALLPLTIPGSIIGMLILFALLSSQILPARWVKSGCHILIRYMALLFVPIGVGVMQYYDQLSKQFGHYRGVLFYQHADCYDRGRLQFAFHSSRT